MALTSITKDFVVKAGALVEGTNFVSSSTGQTSTLQVNGGAAIAKNLVVGTTATIWGNSTLVGNLSVSGFSTVGPLVAAGFTATTSNITGNEQVGGLFTATGATELGSTLKVAGNSLFNGAVNTFSGAVFVTGTNIFTVGSGQATFGGIVSVTTNTAATAAGLGSLLVTGGQYIGSNLVVMGPGSSQTTTQTNALYVAGGIGVEKGGLFGGPVTFRDTVTFNGTSTYVLSTNTFYTDNIIEMHTPPTGVYTNWTVDDGKDIGFRFHYYGSGADQNAALVLDNTSKELHWYSTGAESGGGDFSAATFGTFRTGQVRITTGTANGGNTSTGDLTVFGGVGINGAIYTGGPANHSSVIARNLTTASGIVYSMSDGTLQNTPVTFDSATQRLLGTITTATTAANLTGGAGGSLPYQSAANATQMLPIGTNGQILIVSGGNPTWSAPTGLTAGNATTSSNIAGGLKDQIPYQSAPGQTVFNVGLTYNGTQFTTTNIVVTSNNNATAATGASGALMVTGGVGISRDLWVAGDINVGGNIYMDGVGLDTIQGTTATFTQANITGTVATFSTSSGALQVRGGVGIAGGVFVGGIITGTTVNVTGATTVGTSLTVTGFSSLNGGSTISALTVTNATVLSGTLSVTGYSTLGLLRATDTTVTNLTVTGNEAVTGYTSLNGGATASALTVTNTLLVSGYSTLGLLRAGDTTVTNLTVSGFSSLSGGATASALTVTNAATVGTSLTVTGFSSLNGGATASALTVTNAATVGTTLGVTGRTTLGDAVISAATVTNTLYVNGTTPTLGSATAGAIQTTGGVGIAKDLYVASTATFAGIAYHNNTTPTLGSATAGAIQTTGGVGIAKDLYVGTTSTLAGSLAVTGFSSLSGGATLSAATVTNALAVTGFSSLSGGATVSAATVTNALTVGTTLNVTGRSTLGDVFGTAGATITATNLVITGSASLPPALTFSNLTVTNLTVTNNQTVGGTLTATIFTATGASVFQSTLAVAGVLTSSNVTDSNNTTNGSIVTAGGLGVAKNITVGSAVTIGSASTQTVVAAVYSNNTLYASYTSGFITTNSQMNLDTFSSSAYRTAKYLVQIVDGTKIHVEEIIVLHDGTNVYLTEYGIVTSQGELGTFDANLGGGTITLTFQANYTPTSMTIKVSRQTITL
jgi:hypothetical protein